MVYVNTFNAIIGVGLIIFISLFVVYVAYLWVENLQEKAEASISEEVTKLECNCLSIISDTGRELIVMNVNCLVVEDLVVRVGDEVFYSSEPLYFEDFFIVDYDFKPPYYTVTYNNCSEVLIS